MFLLTANQSYTILNKTSNSKKKSNFFFLIIFLMFIEEPFKLVSKLLKI